MPPQLPTHSAPASDKPELFQLSDTERELVLNSAEYSGCGERALKFLESHTSPVKYLGADRAVHGRIMLTKALSDLTQATRTGEMFPSANDAKLAQRHAPLRNSLFRK